MPERMCIECGGAITYTRGRPPRRCEPCTTAFVQAASRERMKRWREANPERNSEHQKRAYEKARTPETLAAKRDRELRRKYGITTAEVDQLLDAQEHLCAICRRPHRGKGTRLHVDHCHATNRIRGLLCSNCNTLLGLAGDDPARLRAAASYIEAHKT